MRSSSSATLPSARQTGVIQISTTGKSIPSFVPGADSVDFESDLGVPGLGFDYPHLAAINGARSNSSGFAHHGHHGQGFFVPIFGGYPYYYEDSDYEQPQAPAPAQPQPQIIVIEQPAPAQSAVESPNDLGNEPVSPSAPEAAPLVRDVGEFILVQRDGRVLFASMFMVAGTQLTYVTPEGLRRAIALSDLDADATQQMNEARGTTVQIRN